MKTLDNDNELKRLIKEVKLESPGNDFTVKVMNRVFEEKAAIETVKKERILGRGFWIITALFIILIAAMFIAQNMGIVAESNSLNLTEKLDSETLSKGYKSFFNNLDSLPLTIGAILLATSILVFADRLFTGFTLNVTPKTA